jgi:hypothetical protein
MGWLIVQEDGTSEPTLPKESVRVIWFFNKCVANFVCRGCFKVFGQLEGQEDDFSGIIFISAVCVTVVGGVRQGNIE